MKSPGSVDFKTHILTSDRYAVGRNVATTWSYNRMPPSKDKPEFVRLVMGWFDEVIRYLYISMHFKTRHVLRC